MQKDFRVIFLLVFLLNAIIWIAVVPIWHFPDEQSHFGQVAYMAETGEIPDGKMNDLTEEIYISEQLLGTERNNLGNNRFTFHPEYKIEYSNSFVGIYEKEISELSRSEAKSKFVKIEAAHYPKLYYLIASFIYKLFYNYDLFVRIFAIRIYSLVIFAANVLVSYKLACLVFQKNRLYPITIASLVGFQPMMVYANVGVNSDSLGNLIFTLIIYQCLRLIRFGMTKVNLTILMSISLLSIYVKPQFIVTLPLVAILFVFLFLRDLKEIKRKINLKTVIIGIFFTCVLFYLFIQKYLSLISNLVSQTNYPSFFKFTSEYTFSHTISEVVPWYWGVYKWLGVTYPRIVHRIINRLLVFALLGVIFWIYQVIRKRRWHEKEIQCILFLFIINIIFFAAISIYDWFSWYTEKYQLGVQGRYFFPLISSQMIIILISWESILGIFKKVKYISASVLGIMMIALNFVGIFTVISAYYDVSSFEVLLKQISQYKPFLFKAPILVFISFAYIFFLIKYLYLQIIFIKRNN